MANNDHVTIENTVSGTCMARCHNCGRAEVFVPPLPLNAFLAGTKRFAAEHQDCRPYGIGGHYRCANCGGIGYHGDLECPVCDGAGWLPAIDKPATSVEGE